MAKLVKQLSSEEKVEMLQIQRDAAIKQRNQEALRSQFVAVSNDLDLLGQKYTVRKKELEDKYSGVLDDNTLAVNPKSDQLDKQSCAPTS